MKVLLNGASIVQGGGVQSCVGFVRYLKGIQGGIGNWRYVLSSAVVEDLLCFGVEFEKGELEIIELTPARHRASRDRLKQIEKEWAPDVVFTYFGPAYFRPRAVHLCGVADGWVTHSTRLAFSSLHSIRARLHMLLICVYKAGWFRRADAWVVEAESARRGLVKRLGINKDSVYIVPNTYGAHYSRVSIEKREARKMAPWRILTLSAYYPHKNLEIIPEVAAELKRLRPDLGFQFLLTLPEGRPETCRLMARAEKLGVIENVQNVGRVPVEKCPSLYATCDIAFIPSLLETFSAAYPEAMITGTAVVTTDLDFAREICGDAAIYFQPKDAHSAALAITRIISDAELRERVVELARQRVESLLSAQEKHEQLLNTVRFVAEQKKNKREA